jgi:hypothetical protein
VTSCPTYITIKLYPYLEFFGHETDIFMTLHPGTPLALPGILAAVPGILVSLPDILVTLSGIFVAVLSILVTLLSRPLQLNSEKYVSYIPACDYSGNRPSKPYLSWNQAQILRCMMLLTRYVVVYGIKIPGIHF